jgi:hypothetical protein
MTASASELEDEIAHLRDLDLSGLRARWHSVFRRKAPGHLPRHLLYRMIAYHVHKGFIVFHPVSVFHDRAVLAGKSAGFLSHSVS